jgi:hypothetical protein
MFSASVSIALKKTAPLPNTAPLDNWYNVDQEHCIFESMNRAYLPSALPYSEDAAYSASPNRVCTVVILLSLESEFNLANWSGYFAHSSIFIFNLLHNIECCGRTLRKIFLIFLLFYVLM